MSAATAEELHANPDPIYDRVEAGEIIDVIRKGKTIARLVPIIDVPEEGTVDWKNCPLINRDRSNERMMSAEEKTALFEELRG